MLLVVPCPWCVVLSIVAGATDTPGSSGAARCGARYAASPRRTGRSVVSPCWRAEASSMLADHLGELLGAVAAQGGDLDLEVLGGLELLVDRGEAEVGHLVELAQRREDGHADLVRGELGLAGAAQRVLDVLAEAGQVVLGERAALAGLADAGDRLVAVERLGRPGALHHGELHQLEGGEPLLALDADPAAADRAAVLGDPGVEDLGVGVAAERAVHPRSSSRVSGRWARFKDPSSGAFELWITGLLLCRTTGCLWGFHPCPGD